MKKGQQRPVWQLLVEQGHAVDRMRAEALVLAGSVRIAGQVVTAAAAKVPADTSIEVANEAVGRGGEKLRGALSKWEIELQSRVCADVGSSTGGFTEVMLNQGAAKVFAIDVGYGELAWKLRSDARVVVMERTNARYLEKLSEPVSFVAIDVSFISLGLILPSVKEWLAPSAEIVCLVKPQFEAPRELVPKGGIVSDPNTHEQVLREFHAHAIPPGLHCHAICDSPILGRGGNREFLALIRREVPTSFDLDLAIKQLFSTQ